MPDAGIQPYIDIARLAPSSAEPSHSRRSQSSAAILAAVVVPPILTCAFVLAKDTLVFALVVAAVAAAVIIARPFYGLLIFLGLAFVRPEDTFTSLQGASLALSVATVTLMSTWFQLHMDRQPLVRHPMLLVMGGFWVACVLSAVLEGEPFAAALDVGKLFVLVWLVLNLVRTPERYRTYEMLVLLLIGYVALLVTYRSATGQVMLDTEVERAAATGVLGDPNDSAAVIAAGVALALTAALDRSRRYWWLFYPLAAVMAWSIYLTQSRGGMLALVVAIGGSIVVCSRRRARGMALAAVVGLLLIYTVGGRITNFDSQEVSANERLWYWDNGLAMLKSNPLFGAGYGQFTVHNDGRAAHGSLPLAIGETGFVGCFFWLGMFYFAFHGPQAPHPSVPPPRAAVTGHGPPVALAAYLVAVTFLSHTYLPVLYVLATLPVTARFAMNMPASVELSSSRIEFPDFVRIGAMTLAAPVVVKLLIWRFG